MKLPKIIFGVTHNQLLAIMGGQWAMSQGVGHFTSFLWGMGAGLLWMMVMHWKYFNQNIAAGLVIAQDETVK